MVKLILILEKKWLKKYLKKLLKYDKLIAKWFNEIKNKKN